MLQAATGFGFSLVAAPLAFAALEPAPAVGLLLVLGLEVNLLTLTTERRRPRPLVRSAVWMLAFAVPGALCGVAVLRALPPVALQFAVTLGVAATLAARRVTTPPGAPWAPGLPAGRPPPPRPPHPPPRPPRP